MVADVVPVESERALGGIDGNRGWVTSVGEKPERFLPRCLDGRVPRRLVLLFRLRPVPQ